MKWIHKLSVHSTPPGPAQTAQAQQAMPGQPASPASPAQPAHARPNPGPASPASAGPAWAHPRTSQAIDSLEYVGFTCNNALTYIRLDDFYSPFVFIQFSATSAQPRAKTNHGNYQIILSLLAIIIIIKYFELGVAHSLFLFICDCHVVVVFFIY